MQKFHISLVRRKNTYPEFKKKFPEKKYGKFDGKIDDKEKSSDATFLKFDHVIKN